MFIFMIETNSHQNVCVVQSLTHNSTKHSINKVSLTTLTL